MSLPYRAPEYDEDDWQLAQALHRGTPAEQCEIDWQAAEKFARHTDTPMPRPTLARPAPPMTASEGREHARYLDMIDFHDDRHEGRD